jgi:peptidoglycan/xylan/chitin deacetylase (PgdA/CDA1 family)
MGDDRRVIRHALAPVLPAAASSLRLPRMTTADGVAITFDDGPHPQGTPAVLEILARASARATFFLIGEQVDQRPGLAAEIAAQGHAIAVHGYQHRLQLRLSPEAVADDLARATEMIAQATGQTPRCHRPPYGIYSSAGLASARQANLEPLLWSRWGKDWRKFTTPERIVARATKHIRERDVILLHDADFYSARGSHERTIRALPEILAVLAERELATVLPV